MQEQNVNKVPFQDRRSCPPDPEKSVLFIKTTRDKIAAFQEIGRGGEAVVYRLKSDTAAKVFLEPSDPQYASDYALSTAAKERISVMQTKLIDIPSDLPKNVIVPNGVLADADKRIFGYTMPLISDSKNLSEIKKGDKKLNIILQLYDTVKALHERKVIIGDFNENNVLVNSRDDVKLVDTDSMQFGRYVCSTFVPRYTPPEFLNRACFGDNLVLTRKRNETADWYAFLVIAMRILTNTDPFGGTVKDMTLTDRMTRHITIFDKRVVYPINAKPLSSLPRNIAEIFFQAFHRKVRLIPARSVFEEKSFKTQVTKSVATAMTRRQAKKLRSLAFKRRSASKWFKGRQYANLTKEVAAVSAYLRDVRG